MNLWKYISPYLKAHVSAVAAAVALAMTDLSNNGTISLNDWYGIIGAAVGTGALVAAVPNSRTPGA